MDSLYAHRSRMLFELLRYNPMLGTVELIGEKIGCDSLPSSNGTMHWIRRNPDDVGYQLCYSTMGPGQHTFGITYPGMPRGYAAQMRYQLAAIRLQRILPLLQVEQRSLQFMPTDIASVDLNVIEQFTH